MKKIYKKLSKEQIARGVIFSSTLSTVEEELEGNTTHEVFKGQKDKAERIERLLNDKFFDYSTYNFNIVRRP